MSYSIFCDGELIYMPSLQKYALDDAVLEQEVNTSGSLNFTMPDSHPMIGKIPALTAVVEVKKGSRVVFRGRPIKGSDNFYLQNTVFCEGVMGYFNDTYIDPFEFSGTPKGFLEKILSEHNAQVEERKQFFVGIVTVVDSNDFIVRSSEYSLKTMEVIMTRMVESSTGGYVRIRYESDGNYVDWLSDFTEESSQTIEFGQNLIDYLNEIDSTSIVTAIIPLGAMIDGTNNRVTIESVNNGSKSIIDSEAVYQYGYIYATVEWDDITVPANLLQAAKNYLKAQKYARQTITLTALDLSLMDKSIDSFDCCEYVRAKSRPHALDEKMLISQKTTDIIHPENGQITIGHTKSTASGNNRKSQAAARETAQMVIKINGDYVPNIALQEAKEYLTSLISQTESTVNISVEHLRTRLDQLQAEYDGSAEIYFSDEIPNINNYPAINWWTWVYPGEKYPEPDLKNRYFTELDQKTHLGALCYYTTETETSVYRWILSPDGEYKWQEIPQTEMTLLLQRVGELEIDMDQVQASVSSINLTYVSKEELESSLTVLSNEISLDVKGKYATLAQMTEAEAKIELKVGVNEGGKMISAINAAANDVAINADHIKLEGLVTANSNFKINLDGSIEAKNAVFSGTVNALAGTIGPWSIGEYGLSYVYDDPLLRFGYESYLTYSRLVLYYGTKNSGRSSEIGISGIELKNSDDGTVFSLSPYGALSLGTETIRNNFRKEINYIGTEPLYSGNGDGTSEWALKGTGLAWYAGTNKLTHQPTDKGYVLNCAVTDRSIGVHQLWLSDKGGDIFHRGGDGSSNSWVGHLGGTGSPWKKFWDSGRIQFKSVILTVNGGTACRIFMWSDINYLFDITNANAGNTAVFASNGDGAANPSHVTGCTATEDGWYVTFDRSWTGNVRINYMLCYFG